MSVFNLSRKDIRFMKFFYVVGNILAIIPFYDFSRQVILKPFFNKIHSCLFLVLLSVFWSVVFLEDLQNSTSNEVQLTEYALNFLNSACLFAESISLAVTCCLFNQESWLKFNKNFQYVDEKLNNKNKTERNLLKNQYFHFGLAFIAFFFCNFYASYQASKMLPVIVHSKSFCLGEICYSYEFYISVVICNLAIAFKCRFEDLSKCLYKLHTACLNSNKFECVNYVRQIAFLWRKLAENVTCFNKIFGWPLMLLTGRLILQILTSLNLTMSAFNQNHLKLKESTILRELLWTNLVIFTYIALCGIFVIMCCDSASSASRNIICSCYKVQQDFPADSKERMELMNLAREISENPVQFTAANFFEVNRSTFLGILNVTTTYLIIIIQFTD